MATSTCQSTKRCWKNLRKTCGAATANAVLNNTRERDLLARRRHDREQLNHVPTPEELRRGVEEGYKALAYTHEQYGHADSLPEAVQAEANSILIGSIWCSSLGGRQKERETMPFTTVLGMLERDEDFLIATEHKTSSTDGDVATWLPVGLLTCLQHYVQLSSQHHAPSHVRWHRCGERAEGAGPQLPHNIADDLTFRGGGERAPSRSEINRQMLREAVTSTSETKRHRWKLAGLLLVGTSTVDFSSVPGAQCSLAKTMPQFP